MSTPATSDASGFARSGEALAVSVAIVARRHIPELDALVNALLLIEGPEAREIVIGLETQGADRPAETVDSRGVRWIALPPRRGIGYNRQRVLEAARGAILIGVDDDCMPQPGWLTALVSALADPAVHAAVGNIRIPPAGFVGDSISALGFPAGGSAGYATMFRVAADGTTDNIAAGNCALRVSTLRELGGWDESMSYGGEDTELAHRFKLANKRIVFVPAAEIAHPARTSVSEFTRWLYVRGRAKRQFSRKVAINGYVSARLVSYGKIVRANLYDPKIVVILPLLAASILIQQVGFLAETFSGGHRR